MPFHGSNRGSNPLGDAIHLGVIMLKDNIKDFSNQALTLYNFIAPEIKIDNQRDVLALITLKLKAVYDQGVKAGRYYEQYGHYPTDNN